MSAGDITHLRPANLIECPVVGYPDNVLAADEQVVLHRHPHWKRLIGPVLLLIISTAVAAFVAAIVDRTELGSTAKTVVHAGDPRPCGC